MREKNQNVVITEATRRKLVWARAGEINLPRVQGMAFGDGGVDAEGEIISPVEGQNTLAHELFRKPIDGYSFPSEMICRYECTLLESELVGEDISEIGLYDEDGDILCIKSFKRKGKDADVEQTYVLDDVF